MINQKMFDYWNDPVGRLLLLKSSIANQIQIAALVQYTSISLFIYSTRHELSVSKGKLVQ